jgi:hypothetical protein
MKNENLSIEANRLAPVPACSISVAWPPPWLADETAPTVIPAAENTAPSLPPAIEPNPEFASWVYAPQGPAVEQPTPTLPASPSGSRCRRCSGRQTDDIEIHGGLSIRRDCRECGRFVSFPIWYGRNQG